MRSYKYILTSCAILFVLSTRAQENKSAQPAGSKPKRAIQFQSINQIGLLEGTDGGAFQIQTINGIEFRSWFLGIGVGIDNYRLRSVPLFVDLRKEFKVGTNYFFIYGGIGRNFMWPTNKQKQDYHVNAYGVSDFKDGLYYDFGIGYKVPLNNRIAVFISPGFSHKSTETTTASNQPVICPFAGPCYPNPDTYKYALNRLSINVGVVF